MKTIDYTLEEKLIAETITEARKVQEFIWQEDSVSLCPFDKDNWIRIFQKRVDKIKDLKLENPNYFVELRKRLLQQGALSVLALRLISSDESELSALKSAKEEVKSAVNNIEIQEYTFDDYLKLEKETLVKLLMNCQKLLYGNQYATSNNHIESTVQSVKGEGERTAISPKEFLNSKGLKFSEWKISNKDGKVLDVCELMEEYQHSESKDMYPKEFIEFLCDYYQKFWDRYILLNGEHVDPFNTKQPFFTFEEVFNHWSTVITKR